MDQDQVRGDARDASAGRQTARGMIEEMVRNLRDEADGLEALSKALPAELPPQADFALWRVLCSHRHR